MELLAIDNEASALRWVSPKACIVRRADDKRSYIALNGHELLVEDVHKLGLAVWISTLALDIVEMDGKGANAKSVHRLELVD